MTLDYEILVEGTVSELEELVKAYIKRGWLPFGNMTVMTYEVEIGRKGYTERVWYYFQPMTKKTPTTLRD